MSVCLFPEDLGWSNGSVRAWPFLGGGRACRCLCRYPSCPHQSGEAERRAMPGPCVLHLPMSLTPCVIQDLTQGTGSSVPSDQSLCHTSPATPLTSQGMHSGCLRPQVEDSTPAMSLSDFSTWLFYPVMVRSDSRGSQTVTRQVAPEWHPPACRRVFVRKRGAGASRVSLSAQPPGKLLSKRLLPVSPRPCCPLLCQITGSLSPGFQPGCKESSQLHYGTESPQRAELSLSTGNA